MKKWMIFRTEHNFVYYLYQGEHVILIHLPEETNPEAYYWMGMPAKDIPVKEQEALKELLFNTKRVFKLPNRAGIRYIIEQRGTFNEE